MAAIAETLLHLQPAFCDISHESLQDVACETGRKGKLSACASEIMTEDCYLQSQDGPPADVMHCSVCVCVCVCIIIKYWVFFTSLLQPAEHRNGSSAQEWGNV